MSKTVVKIISGDIEELAKNYDVMDMSAVTRYSNGSKFLNRKENVAEHSTHVALNVIKVANMLGIPEHIKHQAVTWAVIHDLSEPVSADLPYEFKMKNEEFMEQFLHFEIGQVEKNYPLLSQDFKDFSLVDLDDSMETLDDKIARVLVGLGDAMVVKQYGLLEQDMGNKTEEVLKFTELASNRILENAEKLTNYMLLHTGL